MATLAKTGSVQATVVASGALDLSTANPFPYLVITDGTDTVAFQDGAGGDTDYPLLRQAWVPQAAGLRRSQLGGRTPYEDCVEELLIGVRGGNAAVAFANLAKLARLLEQAERWARGENVSAVVVKFCPKGARVTTLSNPLQAAILGRADGDETAGVALTGEWNAAGTHYVIPAVRVRFARRGQWLLSDEDTNTPSAADNGNLVTFAMAGAVDIASPTRLAITNFGFNKDGSTRYHGGFVLLGEPVGGSAPIVITAAEGATATAYTSETDAGKNPRNTNVLRYTPTGTTEAVSGALTAALPKETTLVAVFANIRPSATVAFKVRAQLDSELYNQYTPLVDIPANATAYPLWVFLGLVPKKNNTTHAPSLYLRITAAAASSSLDIDTIVTCDARAVQVLALVGPGDDDADATLMSGILNINHSLLTAPQPNVHSDFVLPAYKFPVPYKGDAVFATRSATLYGLLLATGGGDGTDGNEWRQANEADDSVWSNTWTAARRTAYLVPQ